MKVASCQDSAWKVTGHFASFCWPELLQAGSDFTREETAPHPDGRSGKEAAGSVVYHRHSQSLSPFSPHFHSLISCPNHSPHLGP